MTNQIFVFRHCKSAKNDPTLVKVGLKIGISDSNMPLTPEGKEECKVLRRHAGMYMLKNGLGKHVEIISSPYHRAEDTSDSIFRSLGDLPEDHGPILVQTSKDDRLRDHDSGKTLGMNFEQARKNFPEYAKAMDEYPAAYLDAVPPGGESKRECLIRVKEFFDYLKEKNMDVILVTHFDVIVFLIALSHEFKNPLDFDNCVLSLLSNQDIWSSTSSVTWFSKTDKKLSLQESFVRLS